MINYKNVKLKLWSLALIIFILGGISGAAVHALYQMKFSQPTRHGMIENMKKDLSLSDDQAQKIKSILDDSRKDFRKVMKEECPGIQDIRNKTNEKIRGILTPEQQKKFDEIRAKREAMMKSKEDQQ